MTCTQCGSPDGSAASLCPQCIKLNQARRRETIERFKAQPEPTNDLITRMSSPWVSILGAVLLVVGAALTFVMFSKVSDIAYKRALLGMSFGFGLLAFISQTLLFFRLLVMDPMLAVVVLIFPGVGGLAILLRFSDFFKEYWPYIVINWVSIVGAYGTFFLAR